MLLQLPETVSLFVYKIGRVLICPVDTNSDTNSAYLVSQEYQHPLYDEHIIFADVTLYTLRINEDIHTVMIGTLVKLAATPTRKIPRIEAVVAICEPSMRLFDPLLRNFIGDRYTIQTRSVSIESVAGSGKTEILLRLATTHLKDPTKHKKVLYVAFNKALVTGIGAKRNARKLDNLEPRTFDSMLYREARKRFGEGMNLQDLNPHTLSSMYLDFKKKKYASKKSIIAQFSSFCQQTDYASITQMYNGSQYQTLLNRMWEDTVNGVLITFDGIRKLAFEKHWMQDTLDAQYDMVLIDEAQDFDPVMLAILLRDATIPKIFVGDPKQQIYEWRGTINAFEHLPANTLRLHFYSTFRMGGEGVHTISQMTRTPMIAAAACTNLTTVQCGTEPALTQPHSYLFRTWRGLLLTAQTSSATPIWIHEYDKKMQSIERLHARLQKFPMTKDEMQEYEDDDLPAFLMKLSGADLQQLQSDIAERMAPSIDEAVCKLSTVHAFKGMEDDVVRVFGDIDNEEEPNLYYVALTRARSMLYVNPPLPRVTYAPNEDIAVANASGATNPRARVEVPETPLHNELREWRRTKAAEIGKPVFQLFTNRTLNDLAHKKPTTVRDLLKVNGIGDKKLLDFGDDLLQFFKSREDIPSPRLRDRREEQPTTVFPGGVA
jgi:hypothetical protein